MKKALITGISGQDGSYLAEFLLDQGYDVHGLIRRNSSYVSHPNIKNIEHRITLHYSDLTDSTNIRNIIEKVQPDEIYNLAAQSHVAVSFELPEYTADVDALGALRILDTIRSLHLSKQIKFYQASTSELFGLVQETPQKETTPFYPRSPYGVSKQFAHWITKNYREGYDIFACTGILFNHESPRRGEYFVTRKITRGLGRIFAGIQTEPIKLGNLDAKRDWGHARDYVRAMWMIMQQDKPDDYVISTEQLHSVREFCMKAAAHFGMDIEWSIPADGNPLGEVGIDRKTGLTIFAIDPQYFRPAEVNLLLGDSAKAHAELGWYPAISFDNLILDMCLFDKKLALFEKETGTQ